MAYIYLGGFNKDKVVLNNVMRYEPMLDKWTKVANHEHSKSKNGSVLVFRKMTDFQLFIFWFIREGALQPKREYRVSEFNGVYSNFWQYYFCPLTRHNFFEGNCIIVQEMFIANLVTLNRYGNIGWFCICCWRIRWSDSHRLSRTI